MTIKELEDFIERQIRMLIHIHDTAAKIEYLTGLTLDELLDKLAAGWTLQPPTNMITFAELNAIFEEGEDK